MSGKINSGKNQYAEYLNDEFTARGLKVKQDLYAGDLKRFSVDDFKVLGKVLKEKVEAIKAQFGAFFDAKDGYSLGLQQAITDSLDELTFVDDNFFEDKTDITRVLLQTYGTEIARKRFDDHFWIKTMAERINGDTENDVLIVTDARFPNEIEDIQAYINGWRVVPIRINRDIPRDAIQQEHPSEVALDDYCCFEYIIDNNGTLEDLKESSVRVTEDILNGDDLKNANMWDGMSNPFDT